MYSFYCYRGFLLDVLTYVCEWPISDVGYNGNCLPIICDTAVYPGCPRECESQGMCCRGDLLGKDKKKPSIGDLTFWSSESFCSNWLTLFLGSYFLYVIGMENSRTCIPWNAVGLHHSIMFHFTEASSVLQWAPIQGISSVTGDCFLTSSEQLMKESPHRRLFFLLVLAGKW